MGVRRTRERKCTINHGLEAPTAREAVEPTFTETPDHRVLFRLGARLHDRADNLDVVIQNGLQVDTHLPAATQNPDLHETPPVREGSNIARKIRLPDEINHDIDAPPTSLLSNDSCEVLRAVVDDMVGTQLNNTFQLRRLGSRKYSRSGRVG